MAKVEAVLWTQHKTAEGYPVKIRVSHKNEKHYYPLKVEGKTVYLYPDQDDTEKALAAFTEAKDNPKTSLARLLSKAKTKATKAIPEPFNWEVFKTAYTGSSPKDFYTYFEEYLAALLKDQRIGTYLSYQNALQAWKRFRSDVDPLEVLGLLKRFEATIPGKSTRGFYLRATRAVYNYIRDHKMPHLPEWKYTIKSKVSTHKGRALTIQELKAFIRAKGTPAQMEAKRIWLMSFYGGGMNVADLLALRHSDLKGDRIIYTRSKTSRTKDDTIEIPLSRELKELIPQGLGYIIRFDRTGTPLEQKKRLQGFLKNVNRRLKGLCKEHDLPPITTYFARHSFASMLKDKGTSLALISELLGHSDLKTTENYLGRFDFEQKRKATAKVFKLQA